MINRDHWEQVEGIYHAALTHPSETRDSFLKDACAGDEELRREVDSLLKFDQQAAGFIETPALEVAARALAAESTSSSSLENIGPYHLLTMIGQGGTGDVYLAVDRRLDRKVAIKVLSSDFTGDADRISRFRLEARTTSSLNHPNIVTIFEIGNIDGRNYIVTEFVEGDTLRERMTAGLARQLDVKDALVIATQIVDALDAAHQAGIIHRDIKPENIIIRKDGFVKVLDFGIAKLADSGSEVRADHLTTRTGIVMGTASYMSPEQARGQKVDQRTDIFSVGVLLYEMLSGRKPFAGDTWSDVMAAVLIKEPTALALVAPRIPQALQRIVERCLEKSPANRFQTASDLGFALRQVAAVVPAEGDGASVTAGVAAVPRSSQRRAIWVGVIILIGAVAGAGIWFSKSAPPAKEARNVRLSTLAPVLETKTRLAWFDRSGNELGTVGESGAYSGPALSPNEDQIVVALNDPQAKSRDLWIFSATSKTSVRLTSESSDDMNPLWSPDGKWIIYTSKKDGVRNIYRKAADGTGATETVLASPEDLNLEDISHDGIFLAFNARSKPDDSPSLGLLSLPNRKRFSFAPPTARAARFSPDRRWIAYESDSGILVRGAGANGQPSKNQYLVTKQSRGTTPMWRGDGKELFYLDGHTIMAVDISIDAGKLVVGSPNPLFDVAVEDEERRNRYLVTKDGQRFLVIVRDKTSP